MAANVLKNLDVTLEKARREIGNTIPYAVTKSPVPGRLPQTPKARKVIDHAIEEARLTEARGRRAAVRAEGSERRSEATAGGADAK